MFFKYITHYSVQLTYADLEVAASKSKPAPQFPTQDPGHVEYADIEEQAKL